jgi:hypothetical protein
MESTGEEKTSSWSARPFIWAAIIGALFLTAMFLWIRSLPYSGAAGTPWEDFTPDYLSLQLIFPFLFVCYVTLLIRRASHVAWLLCLVGSVVPSIAALHAYFSYLHRAAVEARIAAEGSDPDFTRSVGLSSLMLGLILTALLAAIALYGGLYREKPEKEHEWRVASE